MSSLEKERERERLGGLGSVRSAQAFFTSREEAKEPCALVTSAWQDRVLRRFVSMLHCAALQQVCELELAVNCEELPVAINSDNKKKHYVRASGKVRKGFYLER